MNQHKLPLDPVCDSLFRLALAFRESSRVAPLEEKYKLSGSWRVVVALDLQRSKVQALELTVIAVQVLL